MVSEFSQGFAIVVASLVVRLFVLRLQTSAGWGLLAGIPHTGAMNWGMDDEMDL